MFKSASIRVITPTAVLLAAVGCASAPTPAPDIAGARALISQAEQSDAQRFASADLESSRSKLRQAEEDAHDNKPSRRCVWRRSPRLTPKWLWRAPAP